MTAEEFCCQLKASFPTAEVLLDPATVQDGTHFCEFRMGGLEFCLELKGPTIGVSLIDQDTVLFSGPDCLFGHVPTLVKYLRLLCR